MNQVDERYKLKEREREKQYTSICNKEIESIVIKLQK